MDIEMNKNEDANRLALSNVKLLLDKIEEGGGKKAIEKQKKETSLLHGKGLITSLIRIKFLSRLAHLRDMACMKNTVDAPQAEQFPE
jgi:hypothetical protein